MTDETTWDHVVVGGGSAGCTLARRLAESGRRVLLVEAGPDTPPGAVPATVLDSYPGVAYFDPRLHWRELRVTLGSGTAKREPHRYEQARLMGGGSSINGMFALRGLAADYAEWARLGAAGWAWRDVLPYFRKLERDLDFAGPLHGQNGPIPIRRVPRDCWPGFGEATARALEAMGVPFREDHNGTDEDGFFAMPISNEADQRVSTAIGYLDAATRKRPNLRILPEAEVLGLSFEGTRASGIEVARAGAIEVHRGREIIVSAGALHSPALLLRAGIGPAAELKALSIEVRADVPGVGRNLMEHPTIALGAHLQRPFRQPRGMGRHIHLGWRYSSNLPGCAPGDMHVLAINRAGWHPLGRRLGGLVNACNKPYSRGSVVLRSADPRDEPEVHFNLLADDRDAARLVQGMVKLHALATAPELLAATTVLFPTSHGERSRDLAIVKPSNYLRMAAAAALADFSKTTRDYLLRTAIAPGIELAALIRDETRLEEWVRAKAYGSWHASGTCRMGAVDDGGAVVDEACRVRGVTGLRVVDASVMPSLPRANTNLPTIMVAEKISAAILAEGVPMD